MKKSTVLIIIAVFIFFPLVINNAHAGNKGMKLYDDFEGSGFDGEKWDIIENGGVQINHDEVNGRAEFYFPNGSERVISSWLKFIDCPENIVAIKATFITEGGCPGTGVRGRIGLHAGTFEGDYTWQQMAIQPGDNRIWGAASYQWGPRDEDWYDLFYGELMGGLDLSNGIYTLEIHFDKKEVIFKSDDLGEMIFAYPADLEDITEIFKGIGLRANTLGSGGCRFYVDDVYVQRKGPCDNKKPQAKKIDPNKNVPLDACWVNVTFNEPMTCCYWHLESMDWATWPIDGTSETMWSDDMKTFSVRRNNCGTNLPANTKLEFVVNYDPNSPFYFRDLKGNEAKRKKLTIKTAR